MARGRTLAGGGSRRDSQPTTTDRDHLGAGAVRCSLVPRTPSSAPRPRVRHPRTDTGPTGSGAAGVRLCTGRGCAMAGGFARVLLHGSQPAGSPGSRRSARPGRQHPDVPRIRRRGRRPSRSSRSTPAAQARTAPAGGRTACRPDRRCRRRHRRLGRGGLAGLLLTTAGPARRRTGRRRPPNRKRRAVDGGPGRDAKRHGAPGPPVRPADGRGTARGRTESSTRR